MASRNTQITFLLLLLMVLVLVCISCESKKNESTFADQAVEETLIPVRPGVPGEQPFWNGLARRFIQVPSFDLKEIKGATHYKFSSYSDTDGQTYTFKSNKPWDLLSPIWQDLPVGNVKLTVEGEDERGEMIGVSGTRRFYKAASFNGPYQGAVLSYKESAKLALKTLFNQDHIQHWLKTGEPDASYELNCYASKIIGAVAEGMLLYAGLDSNDSLEAVKIARFAADYLINISEPADAPLAYFPPTYQGDALSAAWFNGQIMLNVPSEAARIYLDLFDVTGDKKYYLAATRIAETYLKLQLPNGTWKLKLYTQSGEPVNPNESIPMDIVELFDRLISQYGLNQFQDSRNRALEWITRNPLKTFNWEGQYEDIILQGPYQNMTKHQSGSYAIYLLDSDRRNDNNIQTAKELIRFAEDQFVIWEKPLPDQSNAFEWLTPCVLEQYRFFEAVDASASKLIAAYQALYEATGEDLYLAKCISLANNMTFIQKRNQGAYSTWWRNVKDGPMEDWVNCAVYDTRVMLQFHNYMETLHQKEKDLTKKDLLLFLSQPKSEKNLSELIDRYHKIKDQKKKIELLTYLARIDIRGAYPLIMICIKGPDEHMKVAALSLLGYKKSITEVELLQGILNSSSDDVRQALLSSYASIADKLLESGNTMVAREYFHQILKKDPAFFDARHALKRLEGIGSAGSLYYIRPYLDNKGLSQIAATSLLQILLRHEDLLRQEETVNLLDIISKSEDLETLKQINLWVGRNIFGISGVMQMLSHKNGFISQWRVVGPFPNNDQDPDRDLYFPEKKIDFSQSQIFSGEKVSWELVQPGNSHGIISFHDLFGERRGIAYAYTELSLPEGGEYVFGLGSNDGVASWVNEQLVHSNLDVGRALKLDEDIVRVRLKKGKNRILLKIPNMGGNWETCLRINDAYNRPYDLTPHLTLRNERK